MFTDHSRLLHDNPSQLNYGSAQVNRVRVHWSDGATAMINNPPCDQLLRVPHP